MDMIVADPDADSTIVQIIDKIKALPIQAGGSLTLTPDAFDMPIIEGLFSCVLKSTSLKIKGAIIKPTTTPLGIVVEGTADLIGYTQLTLTLTFVIQDDQVVISVAGKFPSSKSFSPPLLTWISLTGLGLNASYYSQTGLVQFSVHGSLTSDGGLSLPFKLSQSPPSSWQLEYADDDDGASVTGRQLVSLLGGEALTSFFPQVLIDVLDGFKITGLSAVFDAKAKIISYFSVAIKVTNGWDIAPKVGLLPGLELALTLVDPTDSVNKETIGQLTGTFELGGQRLPLFVQGSVGNDVVWLAGLQPNHSVTLPKFFDLLGLAGGPDFCASLPSAFSDIPAITINKFMIGFNPANKTINEVNFSIQTTSTWSIISNYFEVKNIFVSFDISNIASAEKTVIKGSVRCIFAVAGIPLQCSIQKQAADTGWVMTVSLPPDETIDLVQVAARLFENKIQLPSVQPPTMNFSQLHINIDTESGLFNFNARSTDQWKIMGVNGFYIENFALQFTRDPSKPNSPISGTVGGTLKIGKLDLSLSASLNNTPNGGWFFEGSTPDDQPIAIGELIDFMAKTFGARNLPQSIKGLNLQALSVSFNTANKDFTFALKGLITVANKNVEIEVSITLLRQDDGSFNTSLGGTVDIGDNTRFVLDFTSRSKGNSITASWQQTEDELGLNQIIAGLSLPVPEVPHELDLALARVAFTADLTKNRFVLSADSRNYGKVALVSVPATTRSESISAFVIAIPARVSLSDLPIAGEHLKGVGDVGLSQIAAVALSAEQNENQLTKLNELLPTENRLFPSDSLPAGLSFHVPFHFAGSVYPLVLPLNSRSSGKSMLLLNSDNEQKLAAQTNTDEIEISSDLSTYSGEARNGEVHWINLQKHLGPVAFRRIGVSYQEGLLALHLDASIALGPVLIDLAGLSVQSPVNNFTPSFSLDGMELAFSQPPLGISGAFLRVPTDQTDADYEYSGSAVVSASTFTLSALGSYAQIQGQSSMFVFVFYNRPIGGPPCFFVNGLCGGFGFNRDLRIPSIEQVQDFPLLKALEHPDVIGGANASPLQVLQKLTEPGDDGNGPWISVKPGAYWIAAGLTFSTFEQVFTKAILKADLGGELVISLLGHSTMTLPRQSPRKFAHVEMLLKAELRPEKGFFGMTAMLGPGSYVIDPACKLRGSFAFFLWFDGQHSGQFVLTLGGYHPAFVVPAHFPKVKRLGFDWAVNRNVTICGEAYFALTPSCVMGGGRLEVLYHSGRLKAWFRAYADFLIRWEPFFYEATIGVTVGASYRLNLLVTNKTFSIELGARLKLWGPPTAGEVYVKWSVISFTVKFGSSRRASSKPLSWQKFQEMLPKNNQQQLVGVTIDYGLQQIHKQETSELWLVRPDELVLSTESALPASTLYIQTSSNTQLAAQQQHQTIQGDDSKLDIRPMEIEGLNSTHKVVMYHHGHGDTPIDLQQAGWLITPRRRHVPEALWGKKLGGRRPTPGAKTLPDRAIGLQLVAPRAKLGLSAGDIDTTRNLAYQRILQARLPINKDAVRDCQSKGRIEPQAVSLIKTTIAKADIAKQRLLIQQQLQGLGTSPVSNESMTQYKAVAGELFTSTPMIQDKTGRR